MPIGRPPKLTPALQAQIAEYLWLAFTDEQIALLCDISAKTIQRARRGDYCPNIQKSALGLEARYRRKIWTSKYIPAGACWMLERKYPTQFAKPEIQLSFNNSYTQNNLTINLTSGEAKEIEREANPIREKISGLFKQYRPQLGNGNGDDMS